MNKSVLTTLVATTLGAGLTLGTAVPATAAPSVLSITQVHGKANVQGKAARVLAAEQRKVRAEIFRKDRFLAAVLVGHELAAVDVEVAAAVTENVHAGRVDLEMLLTQLDAATTLQAMRAVAEQVRLLRPQTYRVVTSHLAETTTALLQIADNVVLLADLVTQADTKEAEGYDLTAIRGALQTAALANDAAAAAVDSAVAQGVLLTATSPRAELQAFKADAAAAGEHLALVTEQIQLATDALADMTPISDPVV